MAYGLFGGAYGRRIDPRLLRGAMSGTPFNPNAPMGTPMGGETALMDAAPAPTKPPISPVMDTLMQAGNVGGDNMKMQRPGLFRGLFGGRGSQRVANAGPSFWEWLTLGPGAPDILDQRRMRRELFERGTRDDKREEEDRLALEEAIGGLEPELQPWARIAPEVAAREAFDDGESAGRLATPDEVAALGAEPGTIIWFDGDGRPHVAYRPRARRATQDSEPQLGPGDEWIN